VDSYSAFYDNHKFNATTLLQELLTRGVTHVYLCGIALDVCVAFSALHAAEEGFVTTVVLDACRGVTHEGIAEKKRLMEKVGCQLVNAADVPALLRRSRVDEVLVAAKRVHLAKEAVKRVENQSGHMGRKAASLKRFANSTAFQAAKEGAAALAERRDGHDAAQS